MTKKLITTSIGLLAIFSLLFLAGCEATSNPDVKTVDDLKKLKEAGEPVSELDKCMKEADEGINAYKKFMSECVNEKLETQGYTDGIDCIVEFTNSTCQEGERYNAQVKADNECSDIQPEEIDNRITYVDCLALS